MTWFVVSAWLLARAMSVFRVPFRSRKHTRGGGRTSTMMYEGGGSAPPPLRGERVDSSPSNPALRADETGGMRLSVAVEFRAEETGAVPLRKTGE